MRLYRLTVRLAHVSVNEGSCALVSFSVLYVYLQTHLGRKEKKRKIKKNEKNRKEEELIMGKKKRTGHH